MKTTFLDIMLGDRFYRQLAYKYCPLFSVTDKELSDFVIARIPSLAGKPFSIELSTNKVL